MTRHDGALLMRAQPRGVVEAVAELTVHATDVEQIPVAAGCDQARATTAPTEQRVYAHRMPVENLGDVADLQVDGSDALEHAVFLPDRGEHLPIAHLPGVAVQADDVGERSPDVDADDPFAAARLGHRCGAFDLGHDASE